MHVTLSSTYIVLSVCQALALSYLYALTPDTTMEDKYCYNFILQRRPRKLGEVNLASVMQVVRVGGFAVCPMALKHSCYSTS